MIEQVDEIKAELQVARLPNPGNVIILLQRGIHLEHPRAAVDVTWQVPLCTGSRNGEIRSGEQTVYIR